MNQAFPPEKRTTAHQSDITRFDDLKSRPIRDKKMTASRSTFLIGYSVLSLVPHDSSAFRVEQCERYAIRKCRGCVETVAFECGTKYESGHKASSESRGFCAVASLLGKAPLHAMRPFAAVDSARLIGERCTRFARTHRSSKLAATSLARAPFSQRNVNGSKRTCINHDHALIVARRFRKIRSAAARMLCRCL